MSSSKNIDYSIVICTYNPDERLLKRCLEAVKNFDVEGIDTEIILADNNSTQPVSSLDFVKEYAAKISSMKMIFVEEQGVKYARIAAIKNAVGKFIVYIDYDNEPEKNYLQELKKLNEKYPNVAAWGPGNITVDFIDGIDASLESLARIAFQEKHLEEIKVDNKKEWQPFYPFGTGLCTYKFLLEEYIALAEKGQYTLPGRKGNQLTSGEDTQMILLCISKNYAVGSSPDLKLKHIIPANRANFKYLKKLAYGTTICYETCMVQVFPDHQQFLKNKIISPKKFSRQTLKKYLYAKLSLKKNSVFELISFISTQAGIYNALQKPLPGLVKKIIQKLKLN